MSIASMICVIIYESFLLLRAALEALVLVAQATLQAINLFFDALVTMVTEVIDVVITGYITLLEQAITTIASFITNLLPNGLFCANLFKCLFILTQLLDTSSITFKTMQKLGMISKNTSLSSEETQERLKFIRNMISDFNSFSETVCNFGFTFAYSLDSLKAILAQVQKQVNSFLKTLTDKKNAIVKMVQSYIDMIKNSGIFDLLDKLKSFFKCVLDSFSDTCTSLNTANSFYKDCLEKMNLEESSDGYKFNQETIDTYTSFIEGRCKSINSVKQKAQDVFDLAGEAMGVKGSNNAFNLASLLGSANIADLKNTWRKSGVGKYFVAKSREFKKAFLKEHKEITPDNFNFEYMLNGMTIDEKSGKITLLYNDIKEEIEMTDANALKYNFTMEDVAEGDDIEPIDNSTGLNSFFIDPATGELMSARRAGFIAFHDPTSTVAQAINDTNRKLTEGIPEYNLATAW